MESADRIDPSPPPPSRRVFTNRTLNLRAIGVVGFDMDYTLIHYRPEEWERCAYEQARSHIARATQWPIENLAFVPNAFTLGLVVDCELGNVVKANRFGFVKRASHGMRMLEYEEQRRIYSRVIVDLAEPRWQFMNTLFSLSETCLYAQLVELLDAGKLPPRVGYDEIFRAVRTSLDAAHMEGELKAEIMADPSRFVVDDAETPLALRDLRAAGKKLMLVTNSEWAFARSMMKYAFDGYAPGGSWRNLFDVVIVGARKPDFFSGDAPIFEVVDESGLLRPHTGPLVAGHAYLGGNAHIVERAFGLPGEDILYVGDHVFADVHVSKDWLRWRTALVVRELEAEIEALEAFRPKQLELDRMMQEKGRLEMKHDQLRTELLRGDEGYGPKAVASVSRIRRRMQELRRDVDAIDARVGPLSREASELVSARWGPIMRAGNDKSHLARQIERYADIYTSRVSNLLHLTPFAYLRSPRGSLPHDPG